MDRPKIAPALAKLKLQIQFGSWLDETIYCRMPCRPKGVSEGDLVALVAYSQKAKDQAITPKLVLVAIRDLTRRGLVERYRSQGEWYLRKTKGDRALVLRFI
jgi:hypothetical protein